MPVFPPIVKLQIDEMRTEIVQYLHTHHAAVEDEVARQIEAAIASYDFETQVRNATWNAITEAIKGYFTLGDGLLYINHAVTEFLNEKFKPTQDQQ